MLSVLIDPSRLAGARFGEQMEAFIAWVKQSPTAPGYDKVRISGEPELEMRGRRAAGIPIDVNTWADMQGAARQLGMAEDVLQRHLAAAQPA